ncbi:hypothetical protein [Acidovorax sp. Leaf78]|uniref:hypothetical protein n=1 Tax=Acidovorax sp. Leaf78 TaxID=1736237 RepID=UPI0006FF3152|nr:hypothetical protein [Acidovorax sp. Leaf78]KQO14238.1 hypothetical protein ASF16_18415 [Acidovorax sp. Leaf78]
MSALQVDLPEQDQKATSNMANGSAVMRTAEERTPVWPLWRIVLFGMYAAGLFLLVLFGGNEHDWMLQMDPSIQKGSIESNGNRQVFTGLVLASICVTQGFAIATAASTGQKILSGSLIVLACAIWFVLSFNA